MAGANAKVSFFVKYKKIICKIPLSKINHPNGCKPKKRAQKTPKRISPPPNFKFKTIKIVNKKKTNKTA